MGGSAPDLKPEGGDMADTTILQSFVAMQERKLQAKVDAIAQGGQLAVNHNVSGKGSVHAPSQDVYDSIFDMRFTPRHGHRHDGLLHYEIIPR
jgi:hypothetical protein